MKVRDLAAAGYQPPVLVPWITVIASLLPRLLRIKTNLPPHQ